MSYPVNLQALPSEVLEEVFTPGNMRGRNTVSSLTQLSFPKSRSALWDGSPIGEKLRLQLCSHRNLQVVLLEKALRLAQRHARHSNKSHLHCFFLGSVSVNTDEEGITVTLERFDPGRDQAGTVGRVPSTLLPGDVLVPCLFSMQLETTPDTIVQSEAQLHQCFKVLQQFLSSRQAVNLSNLLKIRAHVVCSQKSDAALFSLSWSAIFPAVIVDIQPVRSVPIIPTALLRSLTSIGRTPQNVSRQRGFLTMDQTRKLVLLLESDPKAHSLPLVGLWLSGVTHVHNPQVWAWCLRFMFSSTLQDRVLSESNCFLLVVFGSTHRMPQFFQCQGSGPGPGSQLDFKLLTAFQSATLYQVAPVEGRSLQCELSSEDHNQQAEVFRAAQKSFNRTPPPAAGLSVSDQDSGVEDEDFSPRPSPRPHPLALQAHRVQPSVPELSLLIDSSFSSNHSKTQDSGSGPRISPADKNSVPPIGSASSSAPKPAPAPSLPHLHSTPNSNMQQSCTCCSTHTYNFTPIFSSPALLAAPPPPAYYQQTPPSYSLSSVPPPASSRPQTSPLPNLHSAVPLSSHLQTTPSSLLPAPPPPSLYQNPFPPSINHPLTPPISSTSPRQQMHSFSSRHSAEPPRSSHKQTPPASSRHSPPPSSISHQHPAPRSILHATCHSPPSHQQTITPSTPLPVPPLGALPPSTNRPSTPPIPPGSSHQQTPPSSSRHSAPLLPSHKQTSPSSFGSSLPPSSCKQMPPSSCHHSAPPPPCSFQQDPSSGSHHHTAPPSTPNPISPLPSVHRHAPPSSNNPSTPPVLPASMCQRVPPPFSQPPLPPSNLPSSPTSCIHPPPPFTPLSTHHHTPPSPLVHPPAVSCPCSHPPLPLSSCCDSPSPHPSHPAADSVSPSCLPRPPCVNRCCDKMGGVAPSDTYQLLLHQDRQLRLLQAQIQMLLEAQGKLQSTCRQVDTQTSRSTASIAVETGASLFWGRNPEQSLHQEEQLSPKSSPKPPTSFFSSTSTSSHDLPVKRSVDGPVEGDVTDHEAHCSSSDQHSVRNQQSPVLGESASMYGPPDEQQSFYQNLMTQLSSRLQELDSEQEAEERTSLSVSDHSRSSQSSSSSSKKKQQQQKKKSPEGDQVIRATLRQLQQLGVAVDEKDLIESDKNRIKAVENASTLASINPAAVVSRLSASETMSSSLFPGGSVDLSLEANAIALRYLTDSQLSKLSLGGHTPQHIPAPSSSSDSLLSLSNMSLATRKYMRRYGLIEEEEEDDKEEEQGEERRVQESRQPLTDTQNVKIPPQSQLIRDLRPKMQLLAGGTKPDTDDKENCSSRRLSLVQASSRELEGSVGNILDLSRLRQLPKLF